jgi:light-regulated signal transduction histidine kinase (bacteriophytochrome)
MSPIHLKYLGNMGVRSSMSVSIVIDSDLWGLVACHGYGELGIRVTLPIRELCRNIGDCAATNIERLLMLQRIESRRPPTTTPPTQNPAGFIAASSADLLRAFGADFGLLSIQDEARAIGKLEPYREALAILAYVQMRKFTTVHACRNINAEFPDVHYPPGLHAISGLLVVPLSETGNDFLVFFRRGELKEVRWAGNPYEKINKPGSDYLEPRMSFKRWTETVRGTSKEWTEDQLETASVLSLLYGRFIEIWRQKESAGQSNKMTRLLIQNAAHEVRTPLNAIVNYLEMALENKIDDNTREILGKASTASRSLVYVINDLLALTKIEQVVSTFGEDVFDLTETILDTLNSFKHEAVRKSLDLTVSTHQGLPAMVKGDPARLRQVLSNITSNAFQHSVDGGIKVDIRALRTIGNTSLISITVQDVGIGMSESQLDVSSSFYSRSFVLIAL